MSSLSYSPVDFLTGTAYTFSAAKSFPADVSVDYSVTNDKGAKGITVDASGDVSVSKDLTADIYTVTVTATPKSGSVNYGGEKKAEFTFRISSDGLNYKPGTSNTERGLFTRGDTDNPYLFQVMDLNVDVSTDVSGTLTFTGGMADFTADLKTSRFLLNRAAFHGIGPKTAVDFNLLTGKDITIDVDAVIDGKPYKTAVSVKGAAPGSIYNWRDLQNMKADISGDYVLMNDIVFPADGVYGNPGNFKPVDLNSTGNNFTGFNGNGKTVGNFKISRANKSDTGLFGTAQGTPAVPLNIKNVTLEHAGVTGGDYTGVLAGIGKNLNISGVTVRGTGTVTGKNHVGALIGSVSDSAVDQATATGDVTGDNFVGGLIGTAAVKTARAKMTVSGSGATGNVTSSAVFPKCCPGAVIAGGLIGNFEGKDADNKAVLINSYAKGNVNAAAKYTNAGSAIGGLAGLAGFADISGDPEKTYASGDVTAKEAYNVGGLIGTVSDSAVNVGKATGNVTGNNKVGGLIGSVSDSAVNSGTATGAVTGSGSNIGGLIGAVSDSAVNDGKATGNVTGDNNVGGLIGTAAVKTAGAKMTVSGSGATGNVNSTSSTFNDTVFTGGLIGKFEGKDAGNKAVLINSYAEGNVNASAKNTVDRRPDDTYPTVKEANVYSGTGGLAGFVSFAEISGDPGKTHASGDVTATEAYNVGGLIGLTKNSVSVTNARAEGKTVYGKSLVGGLIGWCDGTGYSCKVYNSTAGANLTKISISTEQSDFYGLTSYKGGLIGYAVNPDLSGDSATGSVRGYSATGGLVGYATLEQNSTGKINNCFATGKVTAMLTDAVIGGLVGHYQGLSAGRAVITNSYAEGSLNYHNSTTGAYGNSIFGFGGLVGYAEFVDISGDAGKTHSSGNITLERSDNVGGLVGLYKSLRVENAYSTATVKGKDYVGGLLGREKTSAETLVTSVKSSYHTGNVTGKNYVGGIIGKSHENANKTTNLTGVYSLGDISGDKYTGGIAGSLNSPGSITLKGYAVGNVSGTTHVGGLTGETGNHSITGYFRGGLTDSNPNDVSGEIDFIAGFVAGGAKSNIKGYYNGTKPGVSANGVRGTEKSLSGTTCSAGNFPDLSVADISNANIGDFVCDGTNKWPALYMGNTATTGFSPGTQPTTQTINGVNHPF